MISIAQSYYPAWHAYVDGKSARLWQANHAFQALEVPAGQHRVALAYEDKWFHVGLTTSVITLSVWLFGWFRAKPRVNPPARN